jgi:polyhydroxyalkanoate synthesis regulator phasin
MEVDRVNFDLWRTFCIINKEGENPKGLKICKKRYGGEMMESLVGKFLLSGLGVLVLTEEKIEKFIEELTKEGEITQKGKKELLTEIIEKGEEKKKEIEGKIREKVENILSQMNVATKNDIQKLEKRIGALEKKRKG